MAHSQASSCWSTGLTANSLSRQYASFGKIDLPMRAAHSLGSNTCARPAKSQCRVLVHAKQTEYLWHASSVFSIA